MTSKTHEQPCDSLKDFRTYITWFLGAQAVFVLLSFSFSITSSSKVNEVLQRQAEFSERQKVIEKKTDNAQEKAGAALAISAKTEANIEWIRNGQTELKSLVLNYLNQQKKTP